MHQDSIDTQKKWLWFYAGGAIVRKQGRGKEGKEEREKTEKKRRRVSYPHSHTLSFACFFVSVCLAERV